MSVPILSVQNLSMRFGGILALDQISFEVEKNSITALIGPNGAGKTTVFNCITGFYHAQEGNILFRSKSGISLQLQKILGSQIEWKDLREPKIFAKGVYNKIFGGTYSIARLGLARTFQNVRLFNEMTVLENLLVAQHMFLNRHLFSGVFNTAPYKKSEIQALDKAYEWLNFLELEPQANRLAGELPYGKQRLLEIGRAMCIQPNIICLDEPAAGLNPKETQELNQLIQSLCKEHQVTILLIEHDMNMVMNISEKIIVLDYGIIISEGTPEEIKNDPAVISAYLGTETEEQVEQKI